MDAALKDARFWLSREHPADAERVCRRALATNPDQPTLLMLLGQCLIAQDRFREAGDVFALGSILDPGNARMHFFAGVARQGEGRFHEATAFVQRSIDEDPNLAPSHAKLGHIKLLQRKPEEAIASLRRAISLDDQFLPAHVFLANALAEIGEVAEAEAILDRISHQAPHNPDVIQSRGRLFQQQGRFDEAIRAFEETIALVPRATAAFVAISYSRKAEPSHEAFLNRMEELVRLQELPDLDRSLLHFALGKSNDDMGRYETAIGHFDHANQICLRIRTEEGKQFGAGAHAAYVDRVHQLFSTIPCAQPSESDRPVFIVGMVRSGTTLVEQILAAHPQVAAGGELRFWIEQLAKFTAGPEDATPSLYASSIEAYERVLDQISTTARRVTDKMPINYQALGAIIRTYPKARIVHCRRNPIDTCLSVYMTPFFTAPEFAYDREDIVFGYREYTRVMRRWRDTFPPAQILDVRYEQLIADPERSIRELIAFVGLDWDDGCLQHSSARGSVNTPSLWQVRQPLYRGSIDRWRNYEPWLREFLELFNPDPD